MTASYPNNPSPSKEKITSINNDLEKSIPIKAAGKPAKQLTLHF